MADKGPLEVVVAAAREAVLTWLVAERKAYHGVAMELLARALAALEQGQESLRRENGALRRAIVGEHQRSNGSSVYMEGPPQHDRAWVRCGHPLCVALSQAEQG